MKSPLFIKRLNPVFRIAFILTFLGLQAGLPLNGISDSSQAAPARDPESAPVKETGVGTVNPSPLMTAEASVSLGMPSDVMLGENFSFTARFDNTSATSTDIGYGPFIDLVFPVTGGDGDGDGIDYSSASYLGNALEDDFQTFPDDGVGVGCVSHPWLRDATGAYVDVCGDAGDKFVSLRLPFGSFVPDQPVLDISVNATMSNLANISPAMVIRARGGYIYGETALDDWCCGDTPFAEPNDTNSDNWPSGAVTPQVMTFTKAYVGPSNTQDETATGPNYPHKYTLTVDIADGQTLGISTISDVNFVVNDLLPDNVQFIGIDAGATTAGYTLTSTPSTSAPGGTLTLTYDSVTGSTATDDVVITFGFYIPRLDASSGNVISPISGADVNSENIAWAEGDWIPFDGDDPTETLSSDATCPTCPPLHTLEDKSIAIQKSVSVVGGGEPAPGQVLEYSLTFQVSDYFSFGDIVITDTVSDGQHVRLASDFVPTLQVNGNLYTLATDDFDIANYDITCNYTGSTLTTPTECTILGGGTGETILTFRVSDEIINDGENGDMVGGCVDDGGAGLISPCDPANLGNGATTATLIFRTEIQEDFTDNYSDSSVDQGDHLDNTVTILGNVLDNSTFVAGQPEDDDATASVTIGRESLTKTFYAINDDKNSANWETDASGNYIVSPGDKITYRLEYGLNTSDVEGLTFDDYFPLPVFDVADPEQDGSFSGWTFSSTVGIPTPGVVQRENADTFYDYMTAGLGGGTPTGTLTANTLNTVPTQAPVVTSDGNANKIVIAYADYDDTRNQSTKVDLLFSLVVSDDAFADGLFLTNMAHAYEGTTNGDDGTADAIIGFVIGEPVLVGTKGIVWTSNSNTTFDANEGPAGVTFVDSSNAPRWTGAAIDADGLDANPIDANVSGVDAGDTVTFAITIRNTGSSLKGAFDIQLRDVMDSTFYQIPSGGINLQIYYGDGVEAIPYRSVDGSCTVDPAANNNSCGEEIFEEGIEMIDPSSEGICQAHDPNLNNDVIMLTYDLQIKPDVEPGTGVNTVHLINYSGSEDGPNHLPEDQTDDSEATVEIASIDKYLVDTSESHTANTPSPVRLAIGEIVRYRLAVTIPEGQMVNFQLDDDLPAGLIYLDDGTALVGFISNDIGITSGGYNDVPALGACLISGNSVGDIAGALPCVLSDYNVGRTTDTTFPTGDDDDYVTSTDPQFKLGTIQNSDSDDDAELVVVEFNALVANHTGSGENNIGDSRNNDFNLSIDGTGYGSSNNVTGRIVEPVIINLAKTATNPITGDTTGDAGDTIDYKITFANSNGGSTTNVATAFDVVVIDTVPAKMDNISARTLTFTPAACGVLTSDTLVGNDMTLIFVTLDAGCQVTIDYTADLTTAVTPGETLTNSAQILYTSLPSTGTPTTSADNSTGSSTPGGSGDEDGERNGTGTNPPNNYIDTANAPVDVIFLATKTLVSTNLADTIGSDLTIGEIARFRMTVQLGEGTSPSFIFTDNLPAGLQFIDDNSAKVIFVSNGVGISSSALPTCPNNVECDLTGIISGAPFNDGTNPIFSLGDLVNSDTDPDSEFVVLEFNARLINAAAYQSGGSATNNFSVEIDGIDRGTSDDVTVNFVEPVLNIVKTALADTDWLYGETVTYTLDLDHDATSNAPAYDVVVTDTVPSELTYVGSSITAPAGWTTSVSGANLTWTCTASPCSLPVSVTFQATVDSPPAATALDGTTSTATNTANLIWTSLPGAEPTERDGSGSSGGDTWDDYYTSGSHTGELALVAIGNLIWLDTGAGANYNNGVLNGDEFGVNGVDVELYLSTQTPGTDTPVETTTTAGGGFYEFDRLLPDIYFVYIPATEFDGGATSSLTGYRSTTGNGTNEVDDHNFDENGIDVTNLATNGIRTPDYDLQRDSETITDDEASYTGALDDDNVNFTADFGFVELVAIGNRVWLDTGAGADYNDGEFDAGETPVDNVTINLYTSTSTFVATVDTTGGGYYEFDDLLPGQYYVSIPAAEFQAGGDLFGYVSTTTMGSNETSDNDVDENGIDANVAINGIRTQVYDLQPNAEIMLEDQSNYTGAWDDDNVNFTADLSFVRLVAIGNRVWLDTGAGAGIADNGIQDGTETGVSGVQVDLYTSSGTLVTSTLTDGNGDYYFDMLNPGDYYVEIPATEFDNSADALFGYVSSTGNGTDENLDQDADENGIDEADLPTNGIRTPTYTLAPDLEPASDIDTGYTGYLDDDNVNLTADFGFLQFVAIGNRVWLDTGAAAGHYNNGILDADEIGLDGVTVNLYTSAGIFVVSTITSPHLTESGYYEFDRLLPGQYYVQIPATEFQSGQPLFDYVSTTVTGTDGTTDNDADENGINADVLANGIRTRNYDLQPNTMPTADDQVNYTGVLDNDNVNFTADLSFVQLVALGNRIWLDTGAGGGIADNGIQDGSELGVNNATIELFHVGDNPATATPVATTTTNPTGDYQFDLLLTGNYFVHIPASQFQFGGVLEGYVSSTNNGSDESSDQDADENGIDSATLPTDGISSTAYLLTVDGETTADDEGNYTGYLDDNNVNFTADLSFLQKVAVGNRVWLDTGTGGGIADNGILDGGELGVDNVTVELYGVGIDGIASTPDDTSHSSVVTSGGGYYNFDNLLPGGYYLVIPSVEFTGSEALAGYLSSTGNGVDESTDELDAVGDENGIDDASPWINGITSTTYDLQPNLERTSEPQPNYAGALDDDNVNFTADFAFQNNPQVDLGITKDDGQTFYLQGGTLTYMITVTNYGPIDVTGATVSDTLPTQITSWDWACTASTGGATGCDPTTGLTTDFSDLVNLPVNATITYTISAAIDAEATGDLDNTASINPPSGHVDINPPNDTDTDTDHPASITITKDDSLEVVAPGSVITYAVDIYNSGLVDLADLTVIDTLPSDVTYQSATPAPSNITGNVLTWDHAALGIGGNLLANAHTYISITVQVNDTPVGNSITNNITVEDDSTETFASDDDINAIAVDNTKSLVGTSEIDSAGQNTFIGEILTYEINLIIPDGVTMTDLQAFDVLDTGLAFDECVSVSFGVLTTDRADGFTGACPLGGDSSLADPVVTNSGHNVTFNFGNVSNASGSDQTLTIQYWVDVLDIAENIDGVTGLNNEITWSWDAGVSTLTDTANPVDIIEPDMSIVKDASPRIALLGRTITFTVDIAHTAASTADAYDVIVTDILPDGLEYIDGSIAFVGLSPTTVTYDVPSTTLTIVWDHFPLLATSTFTFDTVFIGPSPVINEASVAWTSIPLDPGVQSEYNNDSTERWYDPADPAGVDDYGVFSSIQIRVPALPETGFAPGRVTQLPTQPTGTIYAQFDSYSLEIPRLNETMPIVGIPSSDQGWNLTWLSDQAGWLEGTAYPTWAGNTALTAHAYLADGSPGPFVDLNKLYWGDKIVIRAEGNIYTYQVRDVQAIWPHNLSVLRHEDFDWITLITCRDYNERNDSYTYRTSVRAILVNVQPE